MSQYKNQAHNQEYPSQSNTGYYGNSNSSTGRDGGYSHSNSGPSYGNNTAQQYSNTQQEYPSDYDQYKDPQTYGGNRGYDSQTGGGYPPSKGGYDSQTGGGYPPSKGGYDSQPGGGYPPSNGGYDSRPGGGYPPSNGGYDSRSGGGYPPSKGGYDSQTGDGYPPSNGGYKNGSNQGSGGGDSGYYARDNLNIRTQYPSPQQKDPYTTPFDDPPRSPYNNRSASPYPPSPSYPQASGSPSPRTGYPPSPNRAYSNNTGPSYPPSPSKAYSDPTKNIGSSKPLYDEKDPTAPRPPSMYGSNSGFYDPDKKGHDYEYTEEKPKYGGFMGTFCCCLSGSSCGTICGIVCCVLILIIAAIVIAVLLWAQKPDVELLGIVPSPAGLPSYVKKADGFDFNLGLDIRVNNPNHVGATFKNIKATAFYPGFKTSIGGGNLTDVKIGANRNTTLRFPFSINYDTSIDPNFSIVTDILSKCGFTGGQKQKITIDYTVILSMKVVAITVTTPPLSKNAQIDCPIQNGQLPNIPGLDLGNAFSGKKTV